MIKDGHAIAVAANYGLEATMSAWEGIEHFPRGFDAYSNDMIHPYFVDWSKQHPDYRHHVFTLYDVWVYTHPRFDEMPVVSWVPIDHLPIPEKVAAFISKPNVTPVAMSKYGAGLMSKAGIDHYYIPHGIETSVFKPTAQVSDDVGNVRTGRELMQVDSSQFVVGIVNANKGTSPIRKAFGEQLLAFSIFAERHDDAVLYMHTERYGGMGGIPLDPLIQAVGLDESRVKFVNQYQNRVGLSDEVLAAIYTGMDVLLAPTLGEGFGITVADAQACETPVIVNDFSAQPELLGDGWKVRGQPLWDASQNAWFNTPAVEDIVNALEQAYERKGERSPTARKFIVENYDADFVYENMWRPLLDDLV
jgi:glycosyltransferase involved in cell wall biosynthesis